MILENSQLFISDGASVDAIDLATLQGELQRLRIQLVRDVWTLLRDERRKEMGLSSQTHKATAPAGRCVWYQEFAGGVWTISVPLNPEKVLHVADCLGLGYIQVALREYPKQPPAYRVKALASKATASPTAPCRLQGSSDEEDEAHEGPPDNGLSGYEKPQVPFDRKALADIKQKLDSINNELEEARCCNSQAQFDRLTTEKEEILKHVKAAFGLRNRQRQMSSPNNSARESVGKSIRRAIGKISKIDADAGKFLRKHIKIGWEVSYIGPNVEWKLEP